ncbi:TRAP transporter permease [Chloroflexota bacterium]
MPGRLNGIYRIIFIFATMSSVAIGAYWTFHLGWFGFFEVNGVIYALIGILLPLVFLSTPVKKGIAESKVPLYDIFLALMSFAIPFFFFLNALEIRLIGWEYRAPVEALALGAVLWLLVLEAARRIAGWGLVSIAAIFSFYPLFSGYLPGILYGYQYNLPETIGIHTFSMAGILGIPMQVFYYLLIGYLFFGVVMQFTGGGKFFVGMALSLLGHVRGGPAKVAVVSSALYGTISGSSIANILVTGSFTIPTMKRTGYSSHYAAAVETCASLGGQLTPPIMATTAFIMADWLGISYVSVALAAAIPALAYYVSLFSQVDGYAATHNLKGLPRSETPSFTSVMKTGWVYVLIFSLLLWLMFKMLMVPQAPYIATVALLIISGVYKATRYSFSTLVGSFVDLGKALSSLVAIMTCVGLIISGITFTGIATSIGSEIVVLIGGSTILVVLVTALACVILGMGVSLTACYIIAALLLVPAMVRTGFPPLAAHFFVLYFVNLSGLTPPVCISSYAAASLANAPPMKTGLTAARIGTILFIMPFFIVMRPEILLLGTVNEIIIAAVEIIVASFAIGSALEGNMLMIGRLNLISRILIGLGAVSMVFPFAVAQYSGAIVLAVAVLMALLINMNRVKGLVQQ